VSTWLPNSVERGQGARRRSEARSPGALEVRRNAPPSADGVQLVQVDATPDVAPARADTVLTAMFMISRVMLRELGGWGCLTSLSMPRMTEAAGGDLSPSFSSS
jgi:hypothetical protein